MSATTSNNNTFLMQCNSQRAQRHGFIVSQNKGLNRFSMQCPSPGFTTEQLNMRRKAAILQYPKNATNASTKSSRWSWLATQNKGVVYCEDIYTTEKPSSSSDVPGPVIMLSKDESVPLTMYRNDQYIKFNNVPYPGYEFDWDITPTENVSIINLTTTSIAKLSFGEAAQSNYSFQSIIPISITINADLYNPTYSTQVVTVDLRVDSANLYMYYNDNIFTTVPVDVSHLDHLTISLMDSQDGHFNATKFVGTLNISSINLSVYPLYFLTMRLQLNNSYTEYDEDGNVISSGTNNNVYNTYIGNIANLTDKSDTYYNSSNNCVIEYPPDYNTFQSFSFTNYYSN